MSDFQNHSNTNNAPIMSVKDWLITILILMIPVVNLVMMIVWAINAKNPNKRNYFLASWILFAIMIAIYLLLFLIFGSSFIGATMGSMQLN